MKRRTLLPARLVFLLPLGVLSVFAATGAPKEAWAADDPLASLGWLSGHWVDEEGEQLVEELWLPPRGGLMLGLHRDVSPEKPRAWFEFLRIESRPDGVFYVASPGGRPSTDFRRVEEGETRAVFANPEHDFPKRIVYERRGDRLTARAEGDDGAAVGYAWVRVAEVR